MESRCHGDPCKRGTKSHTVRFHDCEPARQIIGEGRVLKKIFAQPSTAAEAFAFCKAFIDQSNAVIVETGERHWSIFEALCRKSSADGNLIQDAWFAATAIESGCEWITNDRDYSRFEHLRWRTPFN